MVDQRPLFRRAKLVVTMTSLGVLAAMVIAAIATRIATPAVLESAFTALMVIAADGTTTIGGVDAMRGWAASKQGSVLVGGEK